MKQIFTRKWNSQRSHGKFAAADVWANLDHISLVKQWAIYCHFTPFINISTLDIIQSNTIILNKPYIYIFQIFIILISSIIIHIIIYNPYIPGYVSHVKNWRSKPNLLGCTPSKSFPLPVLGVVSDQGRRRNWMGLLTSSSRNRPLKAKATSCKQGGRGNGRWMDR